MPQLYDTIGVGYRALRRPDPRIAAAIADALGSAASVVNVGTSPRTVAWSPSSRRAR
jgi:hypothetical protein